MSEKCFFRMNAKNFFLSWQKCEISKEECLNFLRDEKKCGQIIVSREKHENKMYHLH